MRTRQADPGCHLGWSSRARVPLGPSALLPMRAETSLPVADGTHGTAQLTPSAPGLRSGQCFKEDARRSYGVSGQPSPKMLFAANTSIGERSALRVREEE